MPTAEIYADAFASYFFGAKYAMYGPPNEKGGKFFQDQRVYAERQLGKR